MSDDEKICNVDDQIEFKVDITEHKIDENVTIGVDGTFANSNDAEIKEEFTTDDTSDSKDFVLYNQLYRFQETTKEIKTESILIKVEINSQFDSNNEGCRSEDNNFPAKHINMKETNTSEINQAIINSQNKVFPILLSNNKKSLNNRDIEIELTPTIPSDTTIKQQIIKKSALKHSVDYSCKLCQYKTEDKSALNSHMRTHANEKAVSCEICHNKFRYKCLLLRHMRTHTGERPYACTSCESKFSQQSSLISHMRTHSGERPFVCNICYSKFTQKCSLINHMRTHTGERPFACNICDSKYTRKSDLVIHIRTHTGEKPFSCDRCQFKSRYKYALNTHMRTHDDEIPSGCNIC